jgi:hypothetical protein
VGLILALQGARAAPAATPIYRTQFEATEGYDVNAPLGGQPGQRGWLTDDVASAYECTGLLDGYFGDANQSAYIGYFLETEAQSVSLWYPLNVTYIPSNVALIKFTVLMEIADSENGEYDNFRWSVYNATNGRLFTVDFDLYYLDITYLLDGGTAWLATGQSFQPWTPYRFTLTMDFRRNRWAALLDQTVLVTNQPISTSGKQLSLGDVDTVWYVYNRYLPGDNFMVFDDYEVVAELEPDPRPPLLSVVGPCPTNTFCWRLTGEPNRTYVIDAATNLPNWRPIRTNFTSTGTLNFTETNTSRVPRQFFRARVAP